MVSRSVFWLALLVSCGLGGGIAAADEADRPNILLIMADDLGYSDLGSYGGEIDTPNLDSLAQGGLRYTRFYNSARCCPSRASLLTGLYPHQTGVGHFVSNSPNRPHAYRGSLQDNTVTIAEVLKEAGYRTFMTGKWHVNTPVPTKQGFEDFYGFTHGYATDSWNEKMMTRLPRSDEPEHDYAEGEFFSADAITDYALTFLDEARQNTPDKPWFTFVSYRAPHFPVQAPLEDTQKYVGKYDMGWDKLRQQRLERMKELGLVDADTELPPRSFIPIPSVAKRHGVPGDLERNPAWDQLSKKRQKDLARRMAVYAGMVDNMDQNIGRLLRDLRESGEMDNTLIMFVSDNGASAEWDPFGFDMNEQLMSTNRRGRGIGGGTPGLPNELHTGEALEQMGGPQGDGFSYGSGWANASATPLRGYKSYTQEGGVVTPLIMHWPGRIPEQAEGELRSQRGFIFDLTATAIEAADATYPDRHEGHAITPMEGRSLTPTFEGNAMPDRPLVFEHFSNGALIQGKWKLVSQSIVADNALRGDTDWHLYNIEEDRTEMNDLADKYPERVQRLETMFLNEAWRTRIFPNSWKGQQTE